MCNDEESVTCPLGDLDRSQVLEGLLLYCSSICRDDNLSQVLEDDLSWEGAGVLSIASLQEDGGLLLLTTNSFSLSWTRLQPSWNWQWPSTRIGTFPLDTRFWSTSWAWTLLEPNWGSGVWLFLRYSQSVVRCLLSPWAPGWSRASQPWGTCRQPLQERPWFFLLVLTWPQSISAICCHWYHDKVWVGDDNSFWINLHLLR